MTYVPSVQPPKLSQKSLPEKKIAIRHTVHKYVSQAADAERSVVLLKWAELFMLVPEATLPGKMLLGCVDDEDRLWRTLKDLFITKATSTLKSRAGSVAMWFAWLLHNFPDDPLYPLSEEKLYDYACECRMEGASPSRVDTLVSSLRYVGEVFLFPGATDAANSQRVT